MKRLSMHAAFAALALAAVAVSAVQAVRLQQTQRINDDIAQAAKAPVDTPASSAASASSEAASAPVAPSIDRWRDAPREVRLARATALSKGEAFDAAFKGYSGLIELAQLDGIGRHALYNLGTMHLRQALAYGGEGAGASEAIKTSAQAGPLIELAKQRLRDLLRRAPGDWDARYNLERALRLAPEEHEAVAEENNEPVERRSVMLRGMEPGDLP